jgi:hypothetical protein
MEQISPTTLGIVFGSSVMVALLGQHLYKWFLPNTYDAHHAVQLILDHTVPKSSTRLEGLWLVVRDDTWAARVGSAANRVTLPALRRAGSGPKEQVADKDLRRFAWLGRIAGLLSGVVSTGLPYLVAQMMQSVDNAFVPSDTKGLLTCSAIYAFPGLIVGGLVGRAFGKRSGSRGAVLSGLVSGTLFPALIAFMLFIMIRAER